MFSAAKPGPYGFGPLHPHPKRLLSVGPSACHAISPHLGKDLGCSHMATTP